MKRITKIIALTLAVGGVAGLAACGSTRITATTSPNWNIKVTSRGDLPNAFWTENTEVATYDVVFEKGSNADYQFEYTDGKLVTKFYAAAYDYAGSPYEGKSTPVYVYESEFTVAGKIVMGTNSRDFANSVKTTCYFKPADNNLQPVYSRQEIDNTSPAALGTKDFEKTYVTLTGTYETFYNGDCTEATVKATGADDKKVAVAEEYSVFDVAQLPVVFRSFNYNESPVFDIFDAVAGTGERYNAVFGTAQTLDSEKEQTIYNALNVASEQGYLPVGADENGVRSFRYNAMALQKYSSMPGATFGYWFASVVNSDLNVTRSVMLKYYEQLPFNQGSLTYNLSSLAIEKNG